MRITPLLAHAGRCSTTWLSSTSSPPPPPPAPATATRAVVCFTLILQSIRRGQIAFFYVAATEAGSATPIVNRPLLPSCYMQPMRHHCRAVPYQRQLLTAIPNVSLFLPVQPIGQHRVQIRVSLQYVGAALPPLTNSLQYVYAKCHHRRQACLHPAWIAATCRLALQAKSVHVL